MPQAVRDDWYFQMYYDNLPVWGFIGKVGGPQGGSVVCRSSGHSVGHQPQQKPQRLQQQGAAQDRMQCCLRDQWSKCQTTASAGAPAAAAARGAAKKAVMPLRAVVTMPDTSSSSSSRRILAAEVQDMSSEVQHRLDTGGYILDTGGYILDTGRCSTVDTTLRIHASQFVWSQLWQQQHPALAVVAVSCQQCSRTSSSCLPALPPAAAAAVLFNQQTNEWVCQDTVRILRAAAAQRAPLHSWSTTALLISNGFSWPSTSQRPCL
jgi:hypothetical protein